MRTAVMAWRNLWRYGRRTAATIAAMALGLAAMIVWTSLSQGFLRDLEAKIVEVEVGDVQVYPAGYRDSPSIFDRIDAPLALVDSLGAIGYGASPRLLAGGLAAVGESSAGVSVRGVETARDAGASAVSQRVAVGSWLDAATPTGIVIGSRLAGTLDAGPGSEIVLLGQAADGSIANGLYTVRGVLAPVAEGTDRGGVFMTRAAFLELFALPGGAHQIVVRTGDAEPVDVAAERVRAAAPGFDVVTWRELFPALSSMLDSVEGMMYVLFMVVYLAIAIMLINSTLMAVFERIKELGLLKAVGLPPSRVVALILWEGAFQAALATAAGLAVAVPLILYFGSAGINLAALGGTISISGIGIEPVMRGVVKPSVVVAPWSAMIAIVFASMLYPAVKAARIQPVEAMRHE